MSRKKTLLVLICGMFVFVSVYWSLFQTRTERHHIKDFKNFRKGRSVLSMTRFLNEHRAELVANFRLLPMTGSELSPLVLQRDEKIQPYFIAPILTFPNDTFRQKSIHRTAGIERLLARRESENKLIVLYNLPEHRNFEVYKNSLQNCYMRDCVLSDDKYSLSQADAVMFHALDLMNEYFPRKYPNQMWVFVAEEMPYYFFDHKFLSPKWRNTFNWTMTYRMDSDVVYPPWVLVKDSTKPVEEIIDISLVKSKSVMWLVSHCDAPSNRDAYVKELAKHIQVDVYGPCGDLTCTKTGDTSCDYIQNRQYRFYLAFEDALCRGYISEELFRCYVMDIIPVVRGGAQYNQLLPPGTYINTADFPSPKKLANYLNYLERNTTAYAELLARKWRYRLSNGTSTLHSSVCDVCVKLHDPARFRQVYYDVIKWYTEGICD